ncbi:hypothetical protein [Helcococcus kunzii]|uniref:hypothetical protein n=1 Tax=Helcococcus kunzii TaxID=40091 RepID=UPI0024AD3CE5|nr:hypothetical protein [Helcococcus kunzii]
MKQKKTFSLLFLSLFLIFTACSSSKIKGDIVYGKTSIMVPFQAIYTNEGAYILGRNSVFFYKNGENQLLFSNYIVDDKWVRVETSQGESISISQNFNNYISKKILDDAYIMGDRFYYISEYTNSKGELKYYLSSVNLLGKDKIDHILIKQEPNVFFIADDYFIIGFYTDDQKNYLAYDKKLKEHDLHLNGKQIETIYKSFVFHSKMNEEDNYDIWIYDLKTGKDKLFLKNSRNITALGEGYIAIYIEDSANSNESSFISKIYNIESGKEILTLKDRVIFDFDNNKFYARSDEKLNKYYEYDINGNVLNEVDNKNYPDAFQILAINDGKALVSSNKASNIFYHIDFKNQKIERIEVK